MKRVKIFSLGCIAAFFCVFISNTWAGQVVTRDIKTWAQKAIEQEKTLDIEDCPPNTVAVLYFYNKSGRANLDPLRKGMALMLITDLSKVEKIRVVERARFQALAEELGLGVSGLVTPETSPQVGRILCASTIIGGDILTGELVEIKLSSDLLDVPAKNVFASASSEGALQELFRMEKELLFQIIEQLDIQLTPEERAELEKPLSTDIQALFYLFMGIEASDAGDYDRAGSLYERALKTDPKFIMAHDLLNELRSFGLMGKTGRERSILNDLRQRTSLTDTITPDIRTQRFRNPDQVEKRQSMIPDSDDDGVPDFQDLCPNDPNKTEPGVCGCGVADIDTDGDGIPDCIDDEIDLCPNDPNKTEPGVCGCGIADTDSDRDGIPDCIDDELDLCPNDPNKTEPGVCGCGIADIDSDGDGTPDCIDECPNDPNKTEPGACGCGITDIDSDGDGVPDCIVTDLCPNDPDKTEPGVCGCGIADTDTDGDGTPDCIDGCPSDPDKTEPGVCGCNIADTDTDGDGTPDCTDRCPNDPDKIIPGFCGCDIADTDTDGDGTPDCFDRCPNDPNKTEAGFCGCNVAETDSDSDGTPNCIDGCPWDPDKTTPGFCGCGFEDLICEDDGEEFPCCEFDFIE